MDNRELDDLYLEEAVNNGAETEVTDKVEENYGGNKSGRRNKKRRFTGLAGIIVGIILGAMTVIVVFSVMTIKSKATATDLSFEEKINQILLYLNAYYIDDLDEETIETALAKGLMSNIGDKYAQYYTPEEYSALVDSVTGQYAGIGVLVAQGDDGKVYVAQVYNNSPAQDADIHIMDAIVEAAGERGFEQIDDLVALVRGEPGTTVDLVIERNGEEIPMTVERRYVEVVSADGIMLDDTLGYIQIASFEKNTVQQFKDTVESLKADGMDSLIIDLRGNPGGDYDSVVAVCDYMVPEGPIVTVQNKDGAVFTENSGPGCLDMPMVLLVDNTTASAAELFTMTLMDYDMAEVVGTTTYGKGIVQGIFTLSDGSGLKFTTERYYGPKGKCIQDTGIEPDYLVELPEEVYEDGIVTVDEDTQIAKAAELLGHTIDVEKFMEADEEVTAEY